eukprot:jgi/Mesvir1/14523/Mv05219-RA.2
MGLTTGLCGTLTTFSGWNQQVVQLFHIGRWAHALWALLLGLSLMTNAVSVGAAASDGIMALMGRRTRAKCRVSTPRGFAEGLMKDGMQGHQSGVQAHEEGAQDHRNGARDDQDRARNQQDCQGGAHDYQDRAHGHHQDALGDVAAGSMRRLAAEGGGCKGPAEGATATGTAVNPGANVSAAHEAAPGLGGQPASVTQSTGVALPPAPSPSDPLKPGNIGSHHKHSYLALGAGTTLVGLLIWCVWASIADIEADGSIELWVGCCLAPPGALLRWYLSRLNGRSWLRGKSPAWLPLGTLAANIIGSGVTAGVQLWLVLVRGRGGCGAERVARGIQLGFAGALSTVSTYAVEVTRLHAVTVASSASLGPSSAVLIGSKQWRAYVYMLVSNGGGLIVGLAIYAVPLWVGHFDARVISSCD